MEDSAVEKKEEQLNEAVENASNEGQSVSGQAEEGQLEQDQADEQLGQDDLKDNESEVDGQAFDREMMDQAKEIEVINKAAKKEEIFDEDDDECQFAQEQCIDDVGDDITAHIKGVLEALLFINERPITLEQIKKVLETVSGTEIKSAIKMLASEYAEKKSGIVIREIAGGYQMFSNPGYATYVKSFYKTKHKEKLSKPALESLAIIAYKQPVTRADIELIRGVNSDGVVAHLFNKELIKIVGRKDVPGRPYLYGTTKQFLEYFGLKSMDTLPKLEEFPSLMAEKDDNATKVVESEIIATAPQGEIPLANVNFDDEEKNEDVEANVHDEQTDGIPVENDQERG